MAVIRIAVAMTLFFAVVINIVTSDKKSSKTTDIPKVPVGLIRNGTFPQMSHPVDSDMVIRLPPYAQVRYKVPDHFKKRSAKILFWTPVYGRLEHWSWWFSKERIMDTCPDVACEFTIDKSQLDSSDALIFQVYAGSFKTGVNDSFFRSQLPDRRLPNQRYVFYDSEPPESKRDMSQLNGLFNWTLTYRRDSDVVAHFGRTVLTKRPPYAALPDHDRNFAAGKSKQVAWFVGHCETAGRREEFVSELSKYIGVDIYGLCGNYSCSPPRSEECYDKMAAKYKFYLSFENNLCQDYVTEKFSHVLPYKVVPIVFGSADYTDLAPPGSFIDALAFEGGPRHLAEYLLYLDANDNEYNRFFDWRRGYDAVAIRHPMWVCELCIKLMDTDDPPKVYDDFQGWWTKDAACHAWSPYPVANTSPAPPTV